MQDARVALNLAKTIFHVQDVTGEGEVAFNLPLHRSSGLDFFQPVGSA